MAREAVQMSIAQVSKDISDNLLDIGWRSYGSLMCIGIAVFGALIWNIKHKEYEAKQKFALINTQLFVYFEFHIRRLFATQSEETLSILRTGLSSILHKKCERPTVFTMIPLPGAQSTAVDLSKKLAEIILALLSMEVSEEVIEDTFVDGSDFAQVEEFLNFFWTVKHKLHDHKVAIIKNYQMIHPQSTTLLLNLAHDVFSPHRQSLIILILRTEGLFLVSNTSDSNGIQLAEGFVEDHLRGYLIEDIIDEMKRTICGRVVIVRPPK